MKPKIGYIACAREKMHGIKKTTTASQSPREQCWSAPHSGCCERGSTEARLLSYLAMGGVEGVIDDGAARCLVGGWYSPSARRVRLELRGGLFRTIIVEWAYARTFPPRPHPSQLPGYSSLARVVRVRYDDIGSGGCHLVAGCAVGAPSMPLVPHVLCRTRLLELG